MRNTLSNVFLLSAALALPPLPVAAQAPGPKPSFPAGTEVVTVDAVVIGRGGEAVSDLRREDFVVSEDGVRQELVAFEAVQAPAEPTEATAGAAASALPVPTPLRASSNAGPEPEPASFVVVFDELHLDPAEAARARRAVAGFLQSGARDGDRVSLVGTGDGTRWTTRLPAGRAELLQALDRLQGRQVGESVRDAMSGYEAMRIDQDRDPIVTDQVMRRLLSTGEIRRDVAIPRGRGDSNEPPDYELWRSQTRARAAQVYARAASRAEQTLGVVQRSLEALAGARGRKSLVLVSGGLVQDARLRGFRQVVNASRRANTAVYFLDARGLVAVTSGMQADVAQPLDIIDRSTGGGLDETRDASEGSAGLALDTGGFVLANQNDLGAGLARIGREARSYYLLGYTPTSRAADGRFHRISVKVARENVTVRARRGYFAPGRGEAAAAEPRDAAIQRALDAPFDLKEVPLRALDLALGPAGPSQTSVLLRVEADIRALDFSLKGGVAEDTLETLLLVSQRGSGEFTRFDQQYAMRFQPETRARYEADWFPLTRELKLAPGPYQAKLVARDRNSGRVGSLTHPFEVPSPGGLRVSSLLLSDRLREDGASGARTPELVARRVFAARGTLHVRFEVYGAAIDPASGQPSVSAGFALRRSDGRVLTAAPETPLRPGPGGALARGVGASLEGAPAGRYEVIVLVTDLVAGQTAEAREAIEVEAAAAGR